MKRKRFQPILATQGRNCQLPRDVTNPEFPFFIKKNSIVAEFSESWGQGQDWCSCNSGHRTGWAVRAHTVVICTMSFPAWYRFEENSKYPYWNVRRSASLLATSVHKLKQVSFFFCVTAILGRKKGLKCVLPFSRLHETAFTGRQVQSPTASEGMAIYSKI